MSSSNLVSLSAIASTHAEHVLNACVVEVFRRKILKDVSFNHLSYIMEDVSFNIFVLPNPFPFFSVFLILEMCIGMRQCSAKPISFLSVFLILEMYISMRQFYTMYKLVYQVCVLTACE